MEENQGFFKAEYSNNIFIKDLLYYNNGNIRARKDVKQKSKNNLLISKFHWIFSSGYSKCAGGNTSHK